MREIVTAVSGDNPELADPGASGGLIEDPVLGTTLPPAEHIYFTHGADIWRATSGDEPVQLTDREAIASYSASASGHRIALLRVERDVLTGRERSLPAIHLPDGSAILDLAEYEDVIDLDQMSPIESVALTPSGNGLAMTHQNGALSLVTLYGTIEQLVEPDEERHPGHIAWSSDGRFLTYLDPWMPKEPSSLYLLMPERGLRQILVQPSPDKQGVIQAAWIPGTSQVTYIRSSGSTIDYGGDVFLVDATTGEQELLLSSSEIAPVAGAVDLAVSPDGERIALSAFLPGDEYPEFAGIWLLDLASGEHQQVPDDFDGAVTDLWWFGDDLMFRTIDEPRTSLPGTYTGQESFKLLMFERGSQGFEEIYSFERPADEPEHNDFEMGDTLIINR